MTVVVGEGPDSPAAEVVQAAAHETAVAEGATAVNAEQASQSADEAEAAATAALAATQVNVEATVEAAQAADVATEAAETATLSAEVVMAALAAQTTAINTLLDRTAPKEKPSAPPETSSGDSAPTKEKAPGRKIPAYYRPLGRHR